MSSSAIKYPKRLFSQTGGDASLPARVITLENNEYKITYFAEISSSTGTITIPTGSTILLDQFQGGVDAYVCTIQNGQPTGNFPQTSLGVTVDVASFDALGNFTLSGTPSSYPVALIYILKIKAKDYSNLDITKILDLEDVNAVPYIGATNNVDLGEYELKAGQVTLDITPTGTAAVGTTRWNDTIGSSETTLKGGNVVLKNGVDLVARVVNKVTPNTTLTKAAYQAVRISGAQGQRLAVALAQANNDNNSADTIGLVIETITTNQEGFIMTVGQLEGINTTGSLQGETWVDGDVIYLSPTVAGRLTNVKPTAPQHIVIIGYVEYAHANNGKLYVKVMNGWELEELHNVSTTNYTTPIDTDSVLTYDVTNDIWKRLTLANLRADVLNSNNWVDITATCSILGWISFAINKIKSVDMGSYYIVNGQVVGTSNSSTTQVVLPFTNNGVQLDDCRFAINNGTNIFARCFVLASSNTVDFRTNAAGGLFSSVGTKSIYFTVVIEK